MSIDQLLEKYLKTVHVDWKKVDREVFINPSKREIRDAIEADGYGYRYLIDFKHKNVYIVGSGAFHQTIMDNVPELPNFNDFWERGKATDYIYTGDVSGNRHSSDALAAGIYRDRDELLAHDWTWVNRYLDAKSIIKYINDYSDDY